MHWRIEAARASVIDLAYAKNLRLPLHHTPRLSADPKVNRPLRLAFNFIGDIYAHYATASIYLAEPIVSTAMLTRHVLPAAAKKAFDDWVAAGIRRSGATYPPQPPYDKVDEKYDASGEDPVPLELFDPAWTYTPAGARDALRAFVATLDPKARARSPPTSPCPSCRGREAP